MPLTKQVSLVQTSSLIYTAQQFQDLLSLLQSFYDHLPQFSSTAQ